MLIPDLPNIIETPNHFWFGAVDLPYATQGNAITEPLPNGYVKVTKTFIAKSYTYSDNDSFYDFKKPNVSDKKSKN